MDKFIDSIMQNLPVIILLIPIYILIQKSISTINNFAETYYLTNLNNKNKDNNIPDNLKYQAYERLILFLERIKPESLIPRINNQNLRNSELQLGLIEEIRKEYEYNLTQQLYISNQSWEACTKAKNSMISIINTASHNINNNNTTLDLINNIFKLYIEQQHDIKNAITILKRDIA